jgi:D-alanine-D-alanine ligase
LDPEKYRVLRYDPQDDLPRLVAEAGEIDVALVILHGIRGEDGTIQGLLDLLHIPYQCSGPLGSALAMNKIAAKRLYEAAGIPVPDYAELRRTDALETEKWIARIGLPMVIKPASSGSSIGMSIVRDAAAIPDALETAFSFDDRALLEAYVKGIEITGAVIGNEQLEPLPVVEIVPADHHEYFNFTAKYTPGETREICPARISKPFTEQAQALACRAHEALFCEGYSRTDMILSGDRIYVLETNTIPGMTPVSLLPLAAGRAGTDFSGLLDRLIELGLERGRNRMEKGWDTG